MTNLVGSVFSGCPIETATIPAYACRYITNKGLKKLVITKGTGEKAGIDDYVFSGCTNRLVEVYHQSELGVTVGSTENGYVGYYAKVVYTEPYTTKLSTDENAYVLYTDGDTVCLIGYIGTETNLTLPGNITEINQDAFKWCGNLTDVTMPDSVTAIGTSAFQGCDGLTRITYAGTMAQWNAIAKSDLGWRGTVICSDGTVAVQ